MAFDPDCAALVARFRELRLPRYETLTPAEARAAMAAAREAAKLEPPPIGATLDLVIPCGTHQIAARLYRPLGGAGVLPALLFFHGGGWVLGDLSSHDILCRHLANAGNCAVLAVEYRLAPEHKFPAAIEDAIAATQWAVANAGELEIDPDAIAVGGDSAGATLATVVAHLSRDGKLPRFALQLLIYPTVDLNFTYPSHALQDEALPVLSKTMVWFRDHYLPSASDRSDWRASPLLAERFEGLPSAYVLTAGYDPLCDEGAAYAARMRDAGVAVSHRHYPGQIHGFLTMGPGFPTTKGALAEIGAALKQAFG